MVVPCFAQYLPINQQENQAMLLTQKIQAALNAPTNTAQLQKQYPRDPDTETVVGILPDNLRHLAVLWETCARDVNDAKRVWCATPDDTPEDAVAKANFHAADEAAKAVSAVLWIDTYRALGITQEGGYRLTSDWEVVRMPAEEPDPMLTLLRELGFPG